MEAASGGCTMSCVSSFSLRRSKATMTSRRGEPGIFGGVSSEYASPVERSYTSEPLTHAHDYYQVAFPQHVTSSRV